jgi:hypothetical protein
MEKLQAQIQFLQRLRRFLAGEMGSALGNDTGAQNMIDSLILEVKKKEFRLKKLPYPKDLIK